MSGAGSSTGFIFSYNAEDEDVQALASALQTPPSTFATTTSTTSRRAGLGSAPRRLYVDDDFIPYGPTTYRKGKVRFVPGGLLGGEEEEPQIGVKQEKGKGKATDQHYVKEDEEALVAKPQRKVEMSGNAVKGLYASIVGLRSTPSTSTSSATTPRRSPSPHLDRKPQFSPPSKPTLSSSTTEEDIVLSSDSEPEPPSPEENPSDSEDDDVIILDPLTNLPESRILPPPRKKPRLKPRLIHELLGDSTDPVLVPPTHYALPETNFGYRLLSKQGWKEGATLGKQGGLKVPLKAIEKFDRKGLGLEEKKKAQWKLTAKEKEDERRRVELEERDKRGRGSRGMARKIRMENAERKAWIAYMNR
ncbi:hypothetical protein JCM3765_007145 [Sporobolomyces pararoseus]